MRDIGWLRLPAQCLGDFRGWGGDDIRSGAVDDCSQFGLLLRRHLEFVQRQPNIVHEYLPLLAGNFQVPPRVNGGFEGMDKNGRQERLPWMSDYLFSSI
jgi:hypothetical protein